AAMEARSKSESNRLGNRKNRTESAAVTQIGTTMNSEASPIFSFSGQRLKNARWTIGKKYAAFKTPLTRRTTSAIGTPASKLPQSKNHLLKNPLIGGKPANPIDPIKN